MMRFFIGKNYRDQYTASSKAKLDCEKIASDIGFVNIGLPSSCITNKYWGRIRTIISNILAFLRMPKQGIAFLQYPVNGYKWQVKIARKNKNRIVTIIHDINLLRGSGPFDKEYVEQSDVLIVHTERMKKWCIDNMVCNKIVVLQVFDYLCDSILKYQKRDFIKEDKVKIDFAGNLSGCSFIDKLYPKYFQLNLFGIGIDKRKINKGVVYQGFYHPLKLYQYLKADFGLVWNGEEVSRCTGIYGEYLKYIAPHKLSLYLASGIPVIIWKESAMVDFVKNNRIGVVIDSLDDLNDMVSNITPDEYSEMLYHVRYVQKEIVEGGYLSKALHVACAYCVC